MGCWASTPYSMRRYRDPADLDEEIVPLRYFSTTRPNSVTIPDDIGGLASTHIDHRLATNSNVLLYQAEIDHGQAFRCLRPAFAIFATPCGIIYILAKGISTFMCEIFTCDQACCWVRKEYSTRNWFRIYPNRIEINLPKARFPWGYCGCGSWSSDSVQSHRFDRGAFGFQKVHCGVINHLCCAWPVYGGVVARQRCQCNGPLWNRMFTDCGGWWCDEWLCAMSFCSYKYYGLADADEVSFVSSICLQAYFEGRELTPEDVRQCIDYWQQHISEAGNGPAREVCCAPSCEVPFPTCTFCQEYMCHPRRKIPYEDNDATEELKEAYNMYNSQRLQQIERYRTYQGPVRSSTLCRKAGCKRFSGRKGLFFCTEGCDHFDRKGGAPFPPFQHRDIDDENDASVVLRKVLGDTPPNVVYKRWEFNDSDETVLLITYPCETTEDDGEKKAHGN